MKSINPYCSLFKQLTEQIASGKSIHKTGSILKQNGVGIPAQPGVYAFWWIGEKDALLSSKRKIKFKGPGGSLKSVTYEDWWPSDILYPCLYVGRSTNLRSRFSQHIKNGSIHRLHQIPKSGEKQKPVTTSCQLRYGIEHIFNKTEEPLGIIHNQVGYSYVSDFNDNGLVTRFYLEDLLIGTLRPWFNLDSER